MSDLLEDVRNFLDITWDMDIRERQKALWYCVEKESLEGKIGQCDFESETQEKDILLNFSIYPEPVRWTSL